MRWVGQLGLAQIGSKAISMTRLPHGTVRPVHLGPAECT